MSEKVKNYFNNELYILKQVNHPNIVKLYDTLNNFYLVSDLCNGGGLSNCLEKYKKTHDGKPFPENIVQHILCDKLCQGCNTYIIKKYFIEI